MKFCGVGLLAAAIIGGGLSLACISAGKQETSTSSSSSEPSTPKPTGLAEQEAAAEVTVEEDEFTGVRIATLEADDQPPHGFDVTISVVPGEPSQGARLTIVPPVSDSWEYLRCTTLAAIVDEAPWGFLEAEHDGRTLNGGGVLEFIRVELTEAQIRGLTRATEIRMRLCNDEWTWPLATLHKMRELWQLLYRPEASQDNTTTEAAQPSPQPATQPVHRSCPGGVTTTGHCCTSGRACGGSCISRDRQCHH